MSTILVVTGSARPDSVSDKVVSAIQNVIEQRTDQTMQLADLKELNLPFFNAPVAPADPAFEITDENVKRWSTLVAEADGVILAMPEYNHSLSGIQKNAIDWLFTEWQQKPVAIVGYGWTGASLSLVTAKEVLGHLKATVMPTPANLAFTKHIGPDGSELDTEMTTDAIAVALDELESAIDAKA